MKLFFIFLFVFILFFKVNAEEAITVIELHSESVDQALLNATKKEVEIKISEENNIQELIENDQMEADQNELNNQESLDAEDIQILDDNENNLTDEIMALPDVWEFSNKEELLFLFDNMLLTNSNILNEVLINSLATNSNPPVDFSKEEFDFIKIVNLIKLGQRKKAFEMINLNEINSLNKEFYDLFKLNYFLSTYDLNQVCEYSDSLVGKKLMVEQNLILKIDIFCSFIQDKVEEANFLNSLLEDSDDKDEYFQIIYQNLKSGNKDKINIKLYNYNKNSLPLYSAMLRIGDMPLTNEFLDYDSINFALPIVLSNSSDISLRLNAAHEAYINNIFNSESLSALYQTVDFSFDELNNSNELPNKALNNIPLSMAYYFQKANIQILPITRMQTLVEFWQFAKSQNLNLLAYDVSQNLLDAIEPSPELSEYALEIAKAHIHNNNYHLADKWMLFIDNYLSDDLGQVENISSVKLLYNLKKSNDENEFTEYLIKSNLTKNDNFDYYKQEILYTIFSILNSNIDFEKKYERNLIDNRFMPSRYLLEKIRNSSLDKNYGELILSISVSLNNKTWEEIHPEHLRVILFALKESYIDGIFKNIVIEILEKSKII